MVAELREGAIHAVKIDLGLRALADAEGFEVTDEDLDEEYERLAERFSEPVEDLRHQFEHHAGTAGLRADLRKRAALEWLVEQVALVDGEGNPVDRAALEPPADDEQDPDGEAPSLVAAALDEDDADADADAVDADTEPTEQDAP